jgi:hypothetical protein
MSYRGKVMGVDHIVNKEIEYSYTPKSDWIIIGTTWLDLVFDTLEMTALLLGSYWDVRLLEVKKESCFSCFRWEAS